VSRRSKRASQESQRFVPRPEMRRCMGWVGVGEEGTWRFLVEEIMSPKSKKHKADELISTM
jgi:hypothetical protein